MQAREEEGGCCGEYRKRERKAKSNAGRARSADLKKCLSWLRVFRPSSKFFAPPSVDRQGRGKEEAFPPGLPKHGIEEADSNHFMSSAMSLSVSDQQSDPIGARSTLRGLLELRSALLMPSPLDDRHRAGREASPPDDASGEGDLSSFCLESEKALFSEVQVRCLGDG